MLCNSSYEFTKFCRVSCKLEACKWLFSTIVTIVGDFATTKIGLANLKVIRILVQMCHINLNECCEEIATMSLYCHLLASLHFLVFHILYQYWNYFLLMNYLVDSEVNVVKKCLMCTILSKTKVENMNVSFGPTSLRG